MRTEWIAQRAQDPIPTQIYYGRQGVINLCRDGVLRPLLYPFSSHISLHSRLLFALAHGTLITSQLRSSGRSLGRAGLQILPDGLTQRSASPPQPHGFWPS